MRRIIIEAYIKGRRMWKEVPSLEELKGAVNSCRESSWAVFRLAALMDNFAAYFSPACFGSDGDYRERIPGIRCKLQESGYLLSRYSTLMKYKKLAERIRDFLLLEPADNLLWGFIERDPTEDDDLYWRNDVRLKIRKLYLELEGKNFKQIKAFLDDMLA